MALKQNGGQQGQEKRHPVLAVARHYMEKALWRTKTEESFTNRGRMRAVKRADSDLKKEFGIPKDIERPMFVFPLVEEYPQHHKDAPAWYSTREKIVTYPKKGIGNLAAYASCAAVGVFGMYAGINASSEWMVPAGLAVADLGFLGVYYGWLFSRMKFMENTRHEMIHHFMYEYERKGLFGRAASLRDPRRGIDARIGERVAKMGEREALAFFDDLKQRSEFGRLAYELCVNDMSRFSEAIAQHCALEGEWHFKDRFLRRVAAHTRYGAYPYLLIKFDKIAKSEKPEQEAERMGIDLHGVRKEELGVRPENAVTLLMLSLLNAEVALRELRERGHAKYFGLEAEKKN